MSKLPPTQMVQPTKLVITSSLSQIVFVSSMAISQADRIPVFGCFESRAFPWEICVVNAGVSLRDNQSYRAAKLWAMGCGQAWCASRAQGAERPSYGYRRSRVSGTTGSIVSVRKSPHSCMTSTRRSEKLLVRNELTTALDG